MDTPVTKTPPEGSETPPKADGKGKGKANGKGKGNGKDKSALPALGVGAAVIAGAALAIFLVTFIGDLPPYIMLPIVLIVGVGSLLVTLGTLAVVYKRLKLSDGRQALGLPEGSVRAVLALMLILLFFVSSIFFVTFLSDNEQTRALKGVTAEQLALIPPGDIARQHLSTTDTTTTTELDSTTTQPGDLASAVVASQSTSTAEENQAVVGAQLYDVDLYLRTSADSRELAKQAATAGSTLVAAIAAFYFGATTVQQARSNDKNSGDGRGGDPTKPNRPPADPSLGARIVSTRPPPPDTSPADDSTVATAPEPPTDTDSSVPVGPAGTPIDACDVDWSATDDDSDVYLLDLGLQQGVVVAEPVPELIPTDSVPTTTPAPTAPVQDAPVATASKPKSKKKAKVKV